LGENLNGIWDVPGYRVGKLLIFDIGINGYGIFRPKINGIWDTQRPQIRAVLELPEEVDSQANNESTL
jgi:hypothetical protein